jgi:hypothetical protein
VDGLLLRRYRKLLFIDSFFEVGLHFFKARLHALQFSSLEIDGLLGLHDFKAFL